MGGPVSPSTTSDQRRTASDGDREQHGVADAALACVAVS